MRARTYGHDGVVPTTLVVQLVPFAVSEVSSRRRGRHRLDVRGHETVGERGGVRGGQGRRRPPATPDAAEAGAAAGRHDEQVGPELVDLARDLLLRALAEADGEHDGSDADEDAEHGQRPTASAASGSRRARCAGSRMPAHRHSAPAAGRTSMNRPSRIWTLRRARRGDVGLVGDEDDGASLVVQLVEERRARRRWRPSRGCRSVRRRGSAPGRSPGPAPRRPAAADHRRARPDGGRPGRPDRPGRAPRRPAPCARAVRRRRTPAGARRCATPTSSAAG